MTEKLIFLKTRHVGCITLKYLFNLVYFRLSILKSVYIFGYFIGLFLPFGNTGIFVLESRPLQT